MTSLTAVAPGDPMHTHHHHEHPAVLFQLSHLPAVCMHGLTGHGTEQFNAAKNVVLGFFKAPNFHLTNAAGLYVGTLNNGQRVLLCTQHVVESALAKIAPLLPRAPSPAEVLPEPVEPSHVVKVELRAEKDVKLMLKEIVKANKLAKQARALARAQHMLARACHWTAPLCPPPPTSSLPPHALRSHPNLAHVRSAGGLALSVSQLTLQQPSASEPGTPLLEPGTPLRHADPSTPVPSYAPTPASGDTPDATPGTPVPEAAGAGTASSSGGAISAMGGGGGGSGAVAGGGGLTPALSRFLTPADLAMIDAGMAAERSLISAAVAAAAAGGAAGVGRGPASASSKRGSAASLPSLAQSADGAFPAEGSESTSGQGQGQGQGRQRRRSSRRSALRPSPTVFCSIDLEWWERDQNKITEIGYTMWDNATQELVSRHYIVQENEEYLNGQYVPDHKYYYLWGSSVVAPLRECAAALQRDLDSYGDAIPWPSDAAASLAAAAEQQQPSGEGEGGEVEDGSASCSCSESEASESEENVVESDDGEGGKGAADAAAARQAGSAGASASASAAAEGRQASERKPWKIVLVGHGMGQDLKLLSEKLGIRLPGKVDTVDTATITWARMGGLGAERSKSQVSLRALLKMLGLPASRLHNGGNDARYTMQALLALCRGPPPQPLEEAAGTTPARAAQH